jgi:hypothetical protein
MPLSLADYWGPSDRLPPAVGPFVVSDAPASAGLTGARDQLARTSILRGLTASLLGRWMRRTPPFS